MTVGGAPEVGQGRHRGEDRRRPGHVVLHLGVDLVARLEGDPAGVVHDPLADQRQAARRLTLRDVAQLDHARWLGAALVHTEQPAAAHLDERVLVEDLDLEAPAAGERRGDVGEAGGVQVAVRRVGEVARQLRRRGQRLAREPPPRRRRHR